MDGCGMKIHYDYDSSILFPQDHQSALTKKHTGWQFVLIRGHVGSSFQPSCDPRSVAFLAKDSDRMLAQNMRLQTRAGSVEATSPCKLDSPQRWIRPNDKLDALDTASWMNLHLWPKVVCRLRLFWLHKSQSALRIPGVMCWRRLAGWWEIWSRRQGAKLGLDPFFEWFWGLFGRFKCHRRNLQLLVQITMLSRFTFLFQVGLYGRFSVLYHHSWLDDSRITTQSTDVLVTAVRSPNSLLRLLL